MDANEDFDILLRQSCHLTGRRNGSKNSMSVFGMTGKQTPVFRFKCTTQGTLLLLLWGKEVFGVVKIMQHYNLQKARL